MRNRLSQLNKINNEIENLNEEHIETMIIKREMIDQNNLQQQTLKKALPIQNKGWITNVKEEGVLRIWYVNPNRFGPDKVEKIE